MKHFFTTIALLLFISSTSYAQRSIQGTVFDSKSGEPIEFGSVRLLKVTDSTSVQASKTDTKGDLLLTKVNPGNYILCVSFLGYTTYYQKIAVSTKNLVLKSIQLVENSKVLGTVEVKGTAAQMVVKGDTMEYNASAFKTVQNAVVEDLLKRLPGVEVSTEGKITVNGEEVKKIRVNGKKFFSDDVQMASKNIPAELIDKIQVLDQKSDMALLTGFEDNDTERIINLTFKSNRKQGTFGNVTGGAGLDTNKELRYDGNMFLNTINGDVQTAVTAGGNNTNTSRSGRGRGGWSGGGNSGITTTQNLGVNNNTIINEKVKIGGDASLNHTTNENISDSNRESYLKGTPYTNKSNNNSNNDNYSANMRLELEWKLDSLNTIILQPNLNYNRGFSDSHSDYSYLTNNDSTSWGKTKNYGNSTSLSGGFNIIYNHKSLAKKGRTLTTSLNTSASKNDNVSFNESKKTTATSVTNLNQRTSNIGDNFNYSLRMSLVEPLWNLKNFLESSVSFRNSNSSSEKAQYYRDVLGQDSLYNAEYSNNYTNKFYSETLEFNYRYVTKELNMTFGVKGEPSQTYSYTTYGNGTVRDVENEVVNFSPTGRLQYNLTKKKYARIDYRGQTDQPSVNQLQPVKNNSNLMNETVGNPLLNPSFSHRLNMLYSSFNDSTFSSFNVSLNGQITKDALVSNSVYDATGKQFSQTVNSPSMPFNLNGNIMFNIPLIKKRLHFNTSTSGGMDQRYGYSSKLATGASPLDADSLLILGDQSNTKRYSAGEQLSLTFTHEVIEMGIKARVGYSNTLNNLNPRLTETYDWSASGNVVVHLPNNMNVGTDLNYNNRMGYGGFDQSELLWNASVDKSIFKTKGVISLKLYDILRQQKNIRQSIGDNYIQYNRYNTLTSYFMLSFTYKINKFAGAKNNPADLLPGSERFGPGGDRHQRGDGPPRDGGGRGDGGGRML